MKGYEIEWKGETLYMGELTADMRRDYATWCKQRMLADAKEWMDPNEYINFRQEVAGGGVYWTENPSMGVAQVLNTPDGEVKLNRMLFGDGMAKWSDVQVTEFLTAKKANPKSDYVLAFDLVWEEASPKKEAPDTGPLPVKTAMPISSEPSVASPSTCPEPTPAV